MNVMDNEKTVVNSVERLQVSEIECRICLKICNEVWQLFHPTNEDIPRKMMAFAAVQVEEGDGLPPTICHNCRRLLDVSYDFRCQVEKSDAKLREILLLKLPTEETAKVMSLIPSVSHSVNDAITEAIADEIAQECSNNNVAECGELVDVLTDRSGHIVSEMSQHHFAPHHEQIIFRIEPPVEHDQCVLDQSVAKFDNTVCHDEKHIVMTDCDEHRVVDVFTDKYDNLAQSSLTNEAFKSEPMMMSESELSEDENAEGDTSVEDALKKENIEQRTMVNEKDIEENAKEQQEESDEEERPLIARTQRQKCPNCIKTFATKAALERHEEIHKNKAKLRYVCHMCDKLYADVTKLKAHVVSCNENSRSEEKADDNQADPTRMDKQLGRAENRKNMKFVCKVCGKQFTYQKSFLTHAKTHLGYEPETINEKDEAVVGPSEESNERGHESEDDDMPLEGLQCTQCGKLFATKRNLKRHISTHSGLKFHCSTCSKEFSRVDKLKEHEQSKHKEEFFASSDTDSDDDTDNENKNHDGSDSRKKEKHNRPHQCPMCPKAFAQEQSLTNHMERHKRVKDTQKRFLCEVCSKCFAQSGSLVAHMRTHTGVKPYVCNVCSRAFTKSTYLQLHLRTHSGEKPYICQYCSRAFARANTLARHITMHTGEAKYHCQICMKSFRRLTSLNEHTYTHTGQRPYACKICTKRYNNAGSLYAHTKKCKAQQSSGTATSYTVPVDAEIHQNGSSAPSMMIYSQRKLPEGTSVEPVTPTSQFMITNVHNPSLKALPTNIIPQFPVEDPNFCTVNTKPYKNPYYTIYPNM